MKATSTIETTITIELSPQEVDKWLKHEKLLPEDWQFYSTEVKGEGISNGCKIIVKQEVRGDAKGNKVK